MIKRMLARMRRQPRGQSFIELALVLMILALLLAGVVEYGFMLNNYLHVLDGAREGARYASSDNPFIMNSDGSIATNPPVGGAIEDNLPFYYTAAAKAAITMDPIELNPATPDDIVISVFSVTSGNLPVRFPSSAPNGWSLCANYAAFAAYFPKGQIPNELSDAGYSDSVWASCSSMPPPNGPQSSHFHTADIQSRMDASAPNTGVVLVEIFYNYPQLLKLPVLTSIIRDPISLYVYTIMPLSAAEPTQTTAP